MDSLSDCDFFCSTMAHQCISASVILTLIANGSIAVLAASWQVEQAQKYASDDAMLICTGSTFKWISQSVFFDTGEFSFIEPPEDAPETVHQVDCSYSYLADNQSDQTFESFLSAEFVAHNSYVARLAQRPYTAFPYQKAQPRAPPLC